MVLRRFRLRSKVVEPGPGCPQIITAQFADESVEHTIKGRSM